jgi:hypothetical protein
MSVRIINRLTPSIARVKQQLDQIPTAAYETWIANTPGSSGNAVRSTRLEGNTIHADYPYASVLDEGGSSQNPNGMSRPTAERIQQEVRRVRK